MSRFVAIVTDGKTIVHAASEDGGALCGASGPTTELPRRPMVDCDDCWQQWNAWFVFGPRDFRRWSRGKSGALNHPKQQPVVSAHNLVSMLVTTEPDVLKEVFATRQPLADVLLNLLRQAANLQVEASVRGKKKVTVCAACKRASCWHGVFYCEAYQHAGTITMPVEELTKLGLEHPDYWEKY